MWGEVSEYREHAGAYKVRWTNKQVTIDAVSMQAVYK